MKIFFSTLFFGTFVIFTLGNLQGPESELVDKSKQYERKAAKGLEEDNVESEDSTSKESTDDDSEDSDRFANLLADDLNFPSSGIKIVKAPDLSKDSDNKKISETLALMLESQEKWIQKFEEELEEMNKNEEPEEPQVEMTPEEQKRETEGGYEVNRILNSY